MNYTILWQQSAEDDLANLWLTGADREAVSRVVREIDRRLIRDAHLEGSREKIDDGFSSLKNMP